MDKQYYLEFDFINNPEGRKDNTITKYYNGKSTDLKQSFIIKDEARNKYLVFWSFERFAYWVNLVSKHSYEGFLSPESGFNFHEVCTNEIEQRMRFDIDATREIIDSIPFEVFGDYIATVDEHIERVRAEVYDIEVLNPPSTKAEVEELKIKKSALDMYRDHNWRKIWALILILKDNLLKALAVAHNRSESSYQRRSRNKNFLHTLNASDSKKYSLHLVLENIIFKNYAEVAHIAKIVFDNLNEELLKIVDRNVYKSTQNFRILGAAKFGSNRVMKYCYPTAVVLGAYDMESVDGKPIVNPIGSLKGRIYDSDNYIEMLKRTLLNVSCIGSAYPDVYDRIPNFGRYWRPEEIAPSIENKVAQKMVFTTNDRERAINLFQSDKSLSSAFYPRQNSVSSRIINFNRLRASYCDLCCRKHEKDNTLFLILSELNKGVYVYRKCLKAPTKSVMMGCIREKEAPVEIARSVLDSVDFDNAKKYIATKFDTHIAATRYSEDKMREYELKPTLVVNAQMKMGKTKALIQYIEKNFTNYDTIRIVSFRRTFTNSLALDLPSFTVYTDITGDITETTRRVIIQVESLHRLKDSEPVDLVVLDEFESILDQFSSPNHKELHNSFAMFYNLLNTSKYVICMDANLQDRSYRTLQNMRPQHNIYYHDNQYLRAKDDIYIITHSDRDWIENLLCKLQEEKKIVIPTNSLKFAKSIEALIKQAFPTLKIMAYNSETSESIKNEHFSEVSKHWVNYDVLIYTPTLSAGVSFEVAHYDCLFGYFTDNSCSVEICRQMLGRVRNIIDSEFYLCLRGTGYKGLPTDINRIREYAMARRLPVDDIRAALPYYSTSNETLKTLLGIDAVTYFNTPLAKLLYENTRINNLSKNEFTKRFVSQIVASGAQHRKMPRCYSGIDYEKTMAEVIEKINDQTIDHIYNAPDISKAEYEQYMKMIKGKAKTMYDLPIDIQHKVERYQFKEKYDMNVKSFDSSKLDKVMIKKLATPAMKRNYRNLVDITSQHTVLAALELMKQNESKQFAAAAASPSTKQAEDMTNENLYYKYLKHKVAYDLMTLIGVSLEGTFHVLGKDIFKSVSENLPYLESIMANVRAVRAGYNDAYSVKCVNVDNLRKMLDAKASDESEMAFRSRFNRTFLRSVNTYLKYMYGGHIIVDYVWGSQQDTVYKLANFGDTSLFTNCYNFPLIKKYLAHWPNYTKIVSLVMQEKLKWDQDYRKDIVDHYADPNPVPYPETIEELCDIPITPEQEKEYFEWLISPQRQFLQPSHIKSPDVDKNGKKIKRDPEHVDWNCQIERVKFLRKLATLDYPKWPGVVVEPPKPVVKVETSQVPVVPRVKVWDTEEFAKADFETQLMMMIKENSQINIKKPEYCFQDEDDCGGTKKKYATLSFDPSTSIFPKEIIDDGMTMSEKVDDDGLDFEDKVILLWNLYNDTLKPKTEEEVNQIQELSLQDVSYADEEEYLAIVMAKEAAKKEEIKIRKTIEENNRSESSGSSGSSGSNESSGSSGSVNTANRSTKIIMRINPQESIESPMAAKTLADTKPPTIANDKTVDVYKNTHCAL